MTRAAWAGEVNKNVISKLEMRVLGSCLNILQPLYNFSLHVPVPGDDVVVLDGDVVHAGATAGGTAFEKFAGAGGTNDGTVFVNHVDASVGFAVIKTAIGPPGIAISLSDADVLHGPIPTAGQRERAVGGIVPDNVP